MEPTYVYSGGMSVSPYTRALVLARARSRCECCGQPLGNTCEVHHRRPGGKGGTRRADQDRASNLLALLPAHHNMSPTSVHMRAAQSRELGYLVSTLSDTPPASVPVLLHGRRWVLLTDDGGYEDCPAPV